MPAKPSKGEQRQHLFPPIPLLPVGSDQTYEAQYGLPRFSEVHQDYYPLPVLTERDNIIQTEPLIIPFLHTFGYFTRSFQYPNNQKQGQTHSNTPIRCCVRNPFH